jgi:hypothetical protein
LLPFQLTLPLGLKEFPNFVGLVIRLDGHVQSVGEIIAFRVQPLRRAHPTARQLEFRESRGRSKSTGT